MKAHTDLFNLNNDCYSKKCFSAEELFGNLTAATEPQCYK